MIGFFFALDQTYPVLAAFYPFFNVHGAGSICSKVYKIGRHRPDRGARRVTFGTEIVRTLTKSAGQNRPWRYRKGRFRATGRARADLTYRTNAICQAQNGVVRASGCVARTYVTEMATAIVRVLTKSGEGGGTAEDAKNAKGGGSLGRQQTANGDGNSPFGRAPKGSGYPQRYAAPRAGQTPALET